MRALLLLAILTACNGAGSTRLASSSEISVALSGNFSSPSNSTAARTQTITGNGLSAYKAVTLKNQTDCSTTDFSQVSETPVTTPYTMSFSGDGAYFVCAIGKLGAVWQTTPSQSATVWIDTTSPSLAFTSPATNAFSPTGATLIGTCETGLPLSFGGSGLSAAVNSTCLGGTFHQAVTFSATDGYKAISATQTDLAGNVGTAALTLIQSTPLITSDAALNLGTAASVTYSAPGSSSSVAVVHAAANASVNIWQLVPDVFNLSSGSGSVTQSYSGSGAISWTVNIAGANVTPVNGYPFLFYGNDVFGFHTSGQAPTFPTQLSHLGSLIFDVTYSVTGTLNGLTDVLFDEWLAPTNTYSGGASGAVEVEILPYMHFGSSTSKAGTFIKTLVVPVTLNGTVTTMSFDEYLSGSAGPGCDVLFYPTTVPGAAAASLRFDAKPFFNEAVATANLTSAWYIVGFDFGTEFGDNATQNYTFTATHVSIEESLLP